MIEQMINERMGILGVKGLSGDEVGGWERNRVMVD